MRSQSKPRTPKLIIRHVATGVGSEEVQTGLELWAKYATEHLCSGALERRRSGTPAAP